MIPNKKCQPLGTIQEITSHLETAPPVCFVDSDSLMDDFEALYRHDTTIGVKPSEAILRYVRDEVATKLGTLSISSVIAALTEANPEIEAAVWQALAESASGRRRLEAILLPSVLDSCFVYFGFLRRVERAERAQHSRAAP
jgi:hypothetical protein